MKMRYGLSLVLLLIAGSLWAQQSDYLAGVKEALQKKWPDNRTINLVFHGHSVPSGYFRTPEVRTFDSYPFIVFQELKKRYPYAVINVITTSIGGENSSQGLKRFKKEVLPHRPDVLFIDYALNDRTMGVAQSRKNIEQMVKIAQRRKIPVILMTPSADEKVDLLQPGNELEQFADMLRQLAEQYHVGLADSYRQFKQLVEEKKNLHDYMAQSNHPNRQGHELIAMEILRYF